METMPKHLQLKHFYVLQYSIEMDTHVLEAYLIASILPKPSTYAIPYHN
jgi:hypothetical protein